MEFSGVSAFPITPMDENKVDHKAFENLLQRLVAAGVNSIGVEGSTGNYPYLKHDERIEFARVAVNMAQNIPVIASIGAFRTRDVLSLTENLQQVGVSALLLPVVAYHGLSEAEVLGLYKTVSENTSVPIVLYDSPVISRFSFSDALYARICSLPHIGSIKVPSGWPTPEKAAQRIHLLAEDLPSTTVIGASGDDTIASAFRAGASIWYSEWGGIFPRKARALTAAIMSGHEKEISRLSCEFETFWSISRNYGGSIRPISAVASLLGLTDRDNLPLPLLGVSDRDRTVLQKAILDHGME